MNTSPQDLYSVDVAGNIVQIDKSVIDKMSQKQIEQLIKYSEVVARPSAQTFSTMKEYF
jgi:hypothetical protein